MKEYTIESACGDWVILEPVEQSVVLAGPEGSSVFKILKTGVGSGNEWDEGSWIFVVQHSVIETRVGTRKVYYCHRDSIVGVVGV